MPEWERDGGEGPPTEEALEGTLTRMGPLRRRRAELGAPDPAFVARLRAHLAPDAPLVVAPSPAPYVRPPWQGVRGVVAGLAAAALVAAVLLALLVVVRPRHPAFVPAVAWRPPVPSRADLTRAFPAPAVAPAAEAESPTVSLAIPPHGVPYAGHVALSTVPRPPRPAQLRAFRLAPPATNADPAHVARLARSLGIHAPLRHASRGRAAWLVGVDGGGASHQPLHSLAVATMTGEVVYHDAPAPRREPWVNNPTAVAAARAWLARLGWPAARMPLAAIAHSGLPAGLRAIAFRWVGVGAAAMDAATLWVTPHGQVVEADVWPPVESARSIPARSLTAAWTAVRGGLVPLAVVGVPPHTAASGRGMMRRITITAVLSTGIDHRLYLVPTYHFVGTARLRGIHGARLCYALAPAGR